MYRQVHGYIPVVFLKTFWSKLERVSFIGRRYTFKESELRQDVATDLFAGFSVIVVTYLARSLGKPAYERFGIEIKKYATGYQRL